MRQLALFGAILWALGASLAYPCPKSLRTYLCAALAVNIGTEASWYAFGETSHAYAVAYALFTLLGLLAALNVARDCLARYWHVLAGIGAAGLAVARTYAGLTKPLHFYDYFALTEGAVLFLAGTTLVFSAAHQEHRAIWVTLAALWILQAVFRLGFVLTLPSPAWLNVNEWLPTFLVCAAYGWVAMRLSDFRKEIQA